MSGTPLLVLGARDFSFEIAELAEETGEFEVVGFVENLDPARRGEVFEGHPVHWIDDLGGLADTHLAVCGLGTTKRSAFVTQAAANGLRFATVVHPTAWVPASATLGEGTVVSAGAVVGAKATLGRHVLLNRGVLVGHHAVIGDYVSVMPGSDDRRLVSRRRSRVRRDRRRRRRPHPDRRRIRRRRGRGRRRGRAGTHPGRRGSGASRERRESRRGEAGVTPLIVNVALTGMVPSKEDNPGVPVTPDEIAEDAAVCAEAGATIVHLHARDAEGRPTYRAEVYAEIVAKVRERCPEVIVCVSTSGRVFKTLEERAEVLDLDDDVKPDLASLTLGSLNFPTQASVNEPEMIRALAERMAERGIVPELEVFDLGHGRLRHAISSSGGAARTALLQRPAGLARHARGHAVASRDGGGCAAPGLDVGGRGHRPLPVLRQRACDPDGRARSGRARGQPLARHGQGAARDECSRWSRRSSDSPRRRRDRSRRRTRPARSSGCPHASRARVHAPGVAALRPNAAATERSSIARARLRSPSSGGGA